MPKNVRLLIILIAISLAPAAFGAGEIVGGFPSWEERVIHQLTNRARVAPATDLAACTGCGSTELSGCYAPTTPLTYDLNLGRAARFHSEYQARTGVMAHDTSCVLRTDIGTAYPDSCNGAPSCACTTSGLTSTWTRIGYFGSGGSGENVAYGYPTPLAVFYGWLHEYAPSSACGFSMNNGHRWSILKNGGPSMGAGYAITGTPYWTQDFGGAGGAPSKIVSGAHWSTDGLRQGNTLEFWANWFDGAAPQAATVVVNGTTHNMSLARGTATNGAYNVNLTLGTASCHNYYFSFRDSAGTTIRYPSTGTYAAGGSTCADSGSGSTSTAPTNLTVTGTTATQINLSWAYAGSASTFRIERRGTTGSWYTISEIPGTARTFNNSALPGCTQFYYRVTAVGGGTSTEVGAQTTCTTPAVPTGLVATAVSASQINLGWAYTGSALRFRIDRRGVAGSWYTITEVPGSARTYSNTSLPGCTDFYYRIVAITAAGDSTPSPEATAKTTCLTVTAPTGVVATAVSATQINLSWAFSGTANQFQIERRGTVGSWYTITLVGGTARSYSNLPLPSCTGFFYRVTALTSAGASAPSAEAGATTLCPAPSAPTGLTASAVTATQINLAWNYAGTATMFRIERRGTAGSWYVITQVTGSARTYANLPLPSCTTFFYRVSAIAGDSTSSPSNEASAQTACP